jgi:hypothetical protein
MNVLNLVKDTLTLPFRVAKNNFNLKDGPNEERDIRNYVAVAYVPTCSILLGCAFYGASKSPLLSISAAAALQYGMDFIAIKTYCDKPAFPSLEKK